MDDKSNAVMSGEPANAAGHFCVIGVNVTQNHPITRTWKKTQEAAAKHAERLIKNSFDGNTTKTKKLLVVQVVEVIEVAGPPVTRRTGSAISSEDVGAADSSEDE